MSRSQYLDTIAPRLARAVKKAVIAASFPRKSLWLVRLVRHVCYQTDNSISSLLYGIGEPCFQGIFYKNYELRRSSDTARPIAGHRTPGFPTYARPA